MSETTAVPGNAGRDDYPCMLYHPDGRTAQADNAAEADKLLHEGWSQKPSEIHTRPKPTPSTVWGGGDPLAVLIRSVLEQVLDERGVGKAPGTEHPAPEVQFRNRHK